MKVHQMLVQEIVRNLEFREAFITELERFADLVIEFKEVKEEPIVLAGTFREVALECADRSSESNTPDVVDVGDGFIRVPDGDLIIDGDEVLSVFSDWEKCVGLINDTVSEYIIVRRPYRPIHGWPMEAGWRELSEQEVLQDGDQVNSVSNGPGSSGWISPSAGIGETYRDYHMVARRRIA